jgi:hypothetical protein
LKSFKTLKALKAFKTLKALKSLKALRGDDDQPCRYPPQIPLPPIPLPIVFLIISAFVPSRTVD